MPVAWARAGLVTGLRIDHVDGLRDPQGYLERLARVLPKGTQVVVEKILAPGETLPADWRTDGTTGYEAANLLTGLFTHPTGFDRLVQAYRVRTGSPPFAEVVGEAKLESLRRLLGAEMDALARGLRTLGVPRLAEADAKAAVEAVTASLGVYRTYAREGTLPAASRKAIQAALATTRGKASDNALRRLAQMLLHPATEAQRAWRLRWQQATGAAMAKGFEDCAVYRWAPLAALNEVGGTPDRVGTLQEWHAANAARLQTSPGGLASESTHDTKRSQDVRLRLAVLAQRPEEWLEAFDGWRQAIRGWPRGTARKPVPDPHMEWFLLQTLIAMWPTRGRAGKALVQRVQDYAVKAARDASRHTSWLRPDTRYEQGLQDFVAAAAKARKPAAWTRLVREVQRCGAAASLGALVLQGAAPGVPDIYQGSETWNLLLVDPDNRRPVRAAQLAARLEAANGDVAEMAAHWQDGRVKTHVLRSLLRTRRDQPDLFLAGSYVALAAEGPQSDHVVASMRRHGERACLAIASRWHASLPVPSAGASSLVHADAWSHNALLLPVGAHDAWTDVLTGRSLQARRREGRLVLDLKDVFAVLPTALLAAGAPHGEVHGVT